MYYPQGEPNEIKIYDGNNTEIIIGYCDQFGNICLFPPEAKPAIVSTDENLFILRFARFVDNG